MIFVLFLFCSTIPSAARPYESCKPPLHAPSVLVQLCIEGGRLLPGGNEEANYVE